MGVSDVSTVFPNTPYTAPMDDPLLTHLQDANLDALFPHIHPHLRLPHAHARKLLRPFFELARAEHRDLTTPAPDHHAFLLRAASVNADGTPAAPNTIRARLSALSALYTHYSEQGLLNPHPMRGMPRPAKELRTTPPPDRDDIQKLHRAARRKDPALYVALTLIDQHALTLQEVLTLLWAHYDPERHTLARRYGPTALTNKAQNALHQLYINAGGLLHDTSALDTGRTIFPWKTEPDFRAALATACREALARYFTASDLRRASLRDHPHTPQTAGYAPEDGPRQLARATALAQGVADALTSNPE